MENLDTERDPIERLAESFVTRLRRGEFPSVTEYLSRYPELAEDIEGLLPTLVELEKNGSYDGKHADAVRPQLGVPWRRLGEYSIVREIGRGGMGVVYEAVQESLGRHVALKVLSAHGWLGSQLVRFLREPRSAARLHHANIVPVYGVGEHEGFHYYAMQFIPGHSLDIVYDELVRLRNRKTATSGGEVIGLADESVSNILSSGEFANSTLGSAYYRSVVRLALQVAEALAYAHSQGIIHRDIKPSNLILDGSGKVWVTDFGLAKVDGTDSLTRSGDIVGTLRYMAPECLDGWCDPRSDIYGLGATVFELLALRSLFNGEVRGKLIDCIRHDSAPSLRKCDPLIPRDLETIVDKALAKEPSDRYTTAQQMADDLQRFLTDRPILARRSSSNERMRRWCRRNPLVTALTSAVAVLLLTVALGSAVTVMRLNVALTKTQIAERDARLGRAEALIGQAHGIRLSRRSGQRFESLDSLREAAAIGNELGQPATWFDRLRNEAVAAIALPDIAIMPRDTWRGFIPGSWWVQPSQNFDWYVRSTTSGDTTIFRRHDHAIVAQLPPINDRPQPSFGPRKLLTVLGWKSQELWLWDLNGATPDLKVHAQSVRSHDIRADGTLLAIEHEDASLEVFDTHSGERLYQMAPNGKFLGTEILIHPTEPYLLEHSYYYRDFVLRDMRDGSVAAEISPPWPAGNGRGTWHPGGREVIIPQGDNGRTAIYEFDSHASQLLRYVRELAPVVHNGGTALTINPAGDRVAGRGWNGVVYLWDWHTGKLLFSSVPTESTALSLLSCDTSGRYLGYVRVENDKVGILSIADARQYRAIIIEPGEGVSLKQHAIDPSGRFVAATSSSSDVAFCDLRTGKVLARKLVPGGVSNVRFTDSGDMFTQGWSGTMHWPVRNDPRKPGRIQVGPPEKLALPPGANPMSVSGDGRIVVTSMYAGYGEEEFAGGWIQTTDRQTPFHVAAHDSLSSPTISADNRFVAFFSKPYGGSTGLIQIYKTETGRLEHEFGVSGGMHFAQFTLDNRFLVTDCDGGQILTVGSWQLVRKLGNGQLCDVSPDSTLALYQLPDRVYRLADIESGREIVCLEDPEQNIGGALFTPDGTAIVAAAPDGFRIWDLRLIRKKLCAMGLDWDAPPYPVARPASTAPIVVEFIDSPLADNNLLK